MVPPPTVGGVQDADRGRHTLGVGMPKTTFLIGVGLRAMCHIGLVGRRGLVIEVPRAAFGLNRLLTTLAGLRDPGDVAK